MTAPDCRYEQFCRALGLLPLPEQPRIIGREICTALKKSDGRPQSMGLSPACGLPAFTNMVLSLEEGHGLNVTNECCWASKEDVCGDDRVRVVSVISISIYYPYLLSVRVDGSGVNPQASICFKRFGQDTPQSPLPSAFSFDIFISTAGPGWYADARRDIIRNPDD